MSHRARRLVGRLRESARNRLLPEAGSAADHWQRVVLNRALSEQIDALDPTACSAAEISGAAYADKPWRAHASLDFPDFDLCAPLEGHETYDVVICEQVLEHVIDPCTAATNLRGLCRPGGHVLVSTPFLVRVHELPAYGMRDYWRFTPRGLGVLLERAGLEVLSVESWGNRRVVSANFDRWPAYRRWHSLRNEPGLPIQVWAVARNPGPAHAAVRSPRRP